MADPFRKPKRIRDASRNRTAYRNSYYTRHTMPRYTATFNDAHLDFIIPKNISKYLLDQDDDDNNEKNIGSWWIRHGTFFYIDKEGKEQEIESESEPDVDLKKRPADRGDIEIQEIEIEIQQCDEDVPCFPFHLPDIPPHNFVARDVEGIMWQYDKWDDEWYKIEDECNKIEKTPTHNCPLCDKINKTKMNPENPNHYCLHCDKIIKDWEERRFCCGNCEDMFLFYITSEKREQKIQEFSKKDRVFYKAEDEDVDDDDDGPCLECGKPFSDHPEENDCFS